MLLLLTEDDEEVCLVFFLAAALTCQPQEHGWEAVKKDPCLHFLMAAMAAKTCLLEGFCPLPEKAGFPSARSIKESS